MIMAISSTLARRISRATVALLRANGNPDGDIDSNIEAIAKMVGPEIATAMAATLVASRRAQSGVAVDEKSVRSDIKRFSDLSVTANVGVRIVSDESFENGELQRQVMRACNDTGSGRHFGDFDLLRDHVFVSDSLHVLQDALLMNGAKAADELGVRLVLISYGSSGAEEVCRTQGIHIVRRAYLYGELVSILNYVKTSIASD